MENTVLAYTAGIVDGEGYIGIAKHRQRVRYTTYNLVVVIGNTKPQLIEYLCSNFGGHTYYRNLPKPWKTMYRWGISAKSAGEFLKLILPYLLLKKPHAELALRFQARRRHKGRTPQTTAERALDEADYILMKGYNRRGI